MEIIDAAHIRLRVYERGVGETLACGTGACAAVVVGRNLGCSAPTSRCMFPAAGSSVHWEGPGQPVWLTGPAQRRVHGQVEI